jgi:hypothetical protein
MSSLNLNVIIDKLKQVVFDTSRSLYTRKEAVERLSRIPHKDKNMYITECLMFLLSDEKYPITERYGLFSNNRYLDKEILNSLHIYYFHNFNPPRYPVRLKILSAQYILSDIDKHQIDTRDVQAYLIRLMNDTSQDSSIRTECMDVLKRTGYYVENFDFTTLHQRYEPTQPVREQSRVRPDITKASETRRRILVTRRTVYDDTQNVHLTSINESVKTTVIKLHDEFYHLLVNGSRRISELNEVSKRITELSKQKNPVERQKIIGSLDRIMIDTSRFEKDLSLCDIFIMVWMKLKTSEHREEMEKRMIEELDEMNGLCATGHLSRTVNILSGFFDHIIQITYKDQVKNYIFEHYNKILNNHPKIDSILDEIIEDSWEKKILLSQMIKQYSIYQKLYDEFVSSSLITKTEFEEYYKSSIDNFCGMS